METAQKLQDKKWIRDRENEIVRRFYRLRIKYNWSVKIAAQKLGCNIKTLYNAEEGGGRYRSIVCQMAYYLFIAEG